jgi:hypothetical protein
MLAAAKNTAVLVFVVALANAPVGNVAKLNV